MKTSPKPIQIVELCVMHEHWKITRDGARKINNRAQITKERFRDELRASSCINEFLSLNETAMF